METGDKQSLLIYKYYLDLVYYTNTLCIKYPKSEKLELASETKQSLYICNMLGGWLKSCLTR